MELESIIFSDVIGKILITINFFYWTNKVTTYFLIRLSIIYLIEFTKYNYQICLISLSADFLICSA